MTNLQIELPKPQSTGKITVEEAIARRRSVRDFEQKPMRLEQLSQILWAAQGITEPNERLRAAPSAGALYPLEIYAVVKAGGVADLTAAVYHYEPERHRILGIREGDYSAKLQSAALDQEAVSSAAINIVITAIFERTTFKYGDRGIHYVYQESGHVAQNICLQANALGLGSVVIGAFYDDGVRKVISAGAKESPLCILPIGARK